MCFIFNQVLCHFDILVNIISLLGIKKKKIKSVYTTAESIKLKIFQYLIVLSMLGALEKKAQHYI